MFGRDLIGHWGILAAGAFALAGCNDTPVQPSDGNSTGGPAFAKAFYEEAVGSAINTQGQVVGWSGDYPSLIALLWTPRRPNGSDGAMVGLGTLGGISSLAFDVNTQGQVVGRSFTGGDVNEHAFLWTPRRANGANGSMIDLGTLGGSFSSGASINTQGQVVGSSYTTGDATTHAFLWKPTNTNGTTGSMVDLGTLNGVDAGAGGINTQGQVVGGSGGHIFLWKPTSSNGTTGSMFDLGGGSGVSINAQGQVVGFNSAGHAFLWTPTTANGTSGSMVDLGTLGGGFSSGTDINTRGQVVGYSQLPADPQTGNSDIHAFLWTPTTANGTSGSMVDLGTFGGSTTIARGINTQGQVAGYSKLTRDVIGPTHVFLWTPITSNGTTGTMADIGTLRR